MSFSLDEDFMILKLQTKTKYTLAKGHLSQRRSVYVLFLTDVRSFDFVYVQNSGFLHSTNGGNLHE